jgi:hypothetical protein
MHDTVTNNSRLTCRYAGKYLISGSVEYAANATGVRLTSIRHSTGATNIASMCTAAASAGDATMHTVATIYDMAVNEYVELTAYQSSGGALNVVVTGNRSPEFSMVRVG